MENSMIMKQGVASLKGKWGLAITGNIVVLIISMVLGISGVFMIGAEFAGNILSLIITPPLVIGLCIFSLNIVRDNNPKVDDIFLPFKTNWINAIIAYILLVFLVAVGFILLIIPGIIASLMFSQVFFIMGDDKEIGAYDALVKSMNMMKGYKWKFFKIQLRFFGLGILCVFTLFIGLIWLIPYQYVVFSLFYDDIKDSPSFKNQEYLN